MEILGLKIERTAKVISAEQQAANDKRLAEIIASEEPAPQELLEKWNAKKIEEPKISEEARKLRERISEKLAEGKNDAKFWVGMNRPFGSEEVGRLVEIEYTEPTIDINEAVKGMPKGIERSKLIISLKEKNNEIKKAGRLLKATGVLKGECNFKRTVLIVDGKEMVFSRVWKMLPLEAPISEEIHQTVLDNFKKDESFRIAAEHATSIIASATGKTKDEVLDIIQPLMRVVQEDLEQTPSGSAFAARIVSEQAETIEEIAEAICDLNQMTQDAQQA